MLNYRRDFWPHIVYVTMDALEDPLTSRVLSRLPDVEVVKLSERGDPLTELEIPETAGKGDAEIFSLGKRRLLLTRYRGNWIGHCPGTNDHVCCNLWTVDPGEGCPLDCTYCYLQSFLRRNPTQKLYTNISEMTAVIRQKAQAEPGRLFRICTGERIDSLVWEDLTDLSFELVPLFAEMPNILLELKTKSDIVDNLLQLKDEHRGKTVISWSVNPENVVESDEKFTASLDQRLAAACRVIEAGYRVGFHFDPVIHFLGWQDAYRDLVRKIFSQVSSKSVAWISVSALRYRREMQQMMLKRFPESRIPFGEQFLAKDNKLRYIQPIRFQLINFVWNELKSIDRDMPVYMCMESAAAWRKIAGGPPSAGSELVEVFSRRGRLPIVSENSTDTFAG